MDWVEWETGVGGNAGRCGGVSNFGSLYVCGVPAGVVARPACASLRFAPRCMSPTCVCVLSFLLLIGTLCLCFC